MAGQTYRNNRRKGLVSFQFDKKSMIATEKELLKFMAGATLKTNMTVAKKTYNLVKNSGNIPVDTGSLKASGHAVVKDKFSQNGAIFGWTLPYAKVRYFGVGQEKEYRRVDGKTRSFVIGVTGIPFWDRPITGNSVLMLSIYKASASKYFG